MACTMEVQQCDLKCAPFVYIELLNDASKALFHSLGFTKVDDRLWAGMKWIE